MTYRRSQSHKKPYNSMNSIIRRDLTIYFLQQSLFFQESLYRRNFWSVCHMLPLIVLQPWTFCEKNSNKSFKTQVYKHDEIINDDDDDDDNNLRNSPNMIFHY